MDKSVKVINGVSFKASRQTDRWMVSVPVHGSNRKRWVSTGATTLEKAKLVIDQSGVDRLIALANAHALTENTLALVTAGRKVTGDEVRDSWVESVGQRISPGAMGIYLTHVNAFLDAVKGHNRPLASIAINQVQMFVNRGDVKIASWAIRLASIRSIYKYARNHNFVMQDLAAAVFIQVRNMTIEQLERRGVFPLTDQEYRTVLADPRISQFWKSVTTIAYWTGLRFMDCVCLEWASITDDFLIVWTKKRGKRVCLPLDDPLLGAGELRPIFAAIEHTDPTYVFPKQRAAYMGGRRSRFPTAYKQLLERAGIYFKTFHSTRHAAITRMARAGRTLEEIGRLVAHSNPEVTKNYIHA